ncbi:MAG: bifunctional [glutamine synthetase] adenylyltransferase/[glutamine synthetase]-adenylyl-L-tyrosine phosphorylase [Micrococcales bacterium]|nr:bifunctional [glutamine synthetase] adenylyltransferase/[glutamine synthetase]-adenylyl-L-tyrosine phosphorylase [Micrococcales bacterium]
MARTSTPLTELARLGFADLGGSAERLAALPDAGERILPCFAEAADPDGALLCLLRLRERDPARVDAVLADRDAAARLIRLLGASEGLAAFLQRHPEELGPSLERAWLTPPDQPAFTASLSEAAAGRTGEDAWAPVRIRYRRELVRLTLWDLEAETPTAVLDRVAAALADLAGAALEVALQVARRGSRFPAAEVAQTRLAVIGMGKCGARELNYLSDVDVIFVGESAGSTDEKAKSPGISDERALEIGMRLAMDAMRAIHEAGAEPGLWEVDANLRPEGKAGALVRTLDSHVAYYERWAQGWEFQAQLKARPIAGDAALGAAYVERVGPMVWASSGRDGFVEQVQRMRERVTAHIPTGEVDAQLKLGPGGLRDVEFTIQLLQLVHGAHDASLRIRSTLGALTALADGGYVGREEAAEFAADSRLLRLLEHRVQLRRMRRTHLMPGEGDARRVLARAARIPGGAAGLTATWQRTRRQVRGLHERLFYRPLLSAVAALPDEGFALTSGQAEARLAAIGFADPAGALRHIAALTSGISRRASIQRTLLPVILQWLSEGADPDYGLLAFRRLSDDLGESHWFLRMLRDSSGAAQRLSSVLSSSRFVGVLFERIPEAAAWLGGDGELRPRALETLREESAATVSRYGDDVEGAALALRTSRRREVLRLALAAILGVIDVEELGRGLAAVTTALLQGVLALAHRDGDGIEFGIVAMGRYGGEELGFGSDADVVYVYRVAGAEPEDAVRTAERIVRELNRLTEDLRLPLELDIGLRPEGRNGAVVRSIDSYRAYYARWSLTWEAQALLRARGVAGDASVLREFERMADGIRYPRVLTDGDLREVRRIKARVEAERLPRGADPTRHLKLGRGSLSDVEWLVQLLQLRHGARVPGLRTTSTMQALAGAVAVELISPGDAARLRDAWVLASRARSGLTLWTVTTTDVLPVERRSLEGVARLLEYPPGGAAALEEDYLRTTRLARQVFERLFYGPPSGADAPGRRT